MPGKGKNLTSLQQNLTTYRAMLQKGIVQAAYLGLMQYLMALRTHFQNRYPELAVSGFYQGYMDMSYFACFPAALKERKLKIAVVFVYEAFRFEVWLSGANKQVMAEYWQQIRQSDWNKYTLVADPQKADSILECVLIADPDFGDLDALTGQIEKGTLQFIRDIEEFLIAR